MTAEMAQRALAAARAMATELGIWVTIAVVDEAGHLKLYERMDGAEVCGVQLAQDKAFSALANRTPTAELQRLCSPGGEFYGMQHAWGGRMSIVPGGEPVRLDGAVIGAIGVSGGSGDQDVACARAGVEAAGG